MARLCRIRHPVNARERGQSSRMSVEDPGFWLAVFQIIWIDILLSGDNAVVIALACRKLPPRQRMWGIVLGTLVAISLRVIFTGMVTQLMTMPYVKLVGGVLLFWIAVKLLGGEENEREIEAVDSLWKAIKIVAIADVVMSLDNIIAVAAAARGSYALLMFGLAVSIPLIMAGAAIVIALLERYPVIVWAGAALLGWIAGEIIAGDPLFTQHLDPVMAHTVHLGAAMAGALLVLLIGVVRRRLNRRSAPDRV
jgi:YjbE family integral membrane protein